MGMPTFSKAGVTTWTAEKGESVPYSRTPIPRQVHTESEDGTDQVSNLGSLTYQIPLRFKNVSVSNYNDLVSFFSNALVNWSVNTFTYTDSASAGHTVRLAPLSFQYSVSANQVTVSMMLKET